MKKIQIKTYIFYEIGDSCRVEFMMRDGQFRPTEDAVVIGISEGRCYKEAFERLIQRDSWVKGYKIDRVEARQIGEPFYL